MEEYIHDRYYATSNKKFIDIHESCKVSIEWWLSKLLFKGDLKRIVYSTPDNAFRKRIESLDAGKDEDAVLEPIQLGLPFASYCMTGDVEPDDRMAAVNAGEAVEGIYYEDVDKTMKRLAVKTHYTCTCYFTRQDDVRQAAQLLLWEKEPQFPIRLYTIIEWRNMMVDLPTFMTIESIDTNPAYQESDWLTKNRIFPVKVELTIRTYELVINNVDKIVQFPIRFGNFKDLYEEDDEHVEYLTEQVVLNWATHKFDVDMNEEEVNTDSVDYTALKSRYFYHDEISEGEVLKNAEKIPNEYTTDIIQAYYTTATTCYLRKYQYDSVKSTATSAHIVFKVQPSTFKYFDKMTLYIPTKDLVTVTDCHATETYFEGLLPNSTYTMQIRLYAIDGTIQHYKLKFTTPDSDDNEAPQPEEINVVNGLVGMTF